MFRILIGAKDLAVAQRFYEKLLGVTGRVVGGGRVYFDCGSVILGVLDFSSRDGQDWSGPTESIYFATADLNGVHARARALNCLAEGLLHEDPSSPLGEVVVRPWGERSFYAVDPSDNSLCFVDESTLFTGTPEQVAALRRGSPSSS